MAKSLCADGKELMGVRTAHGAVTAFRYFRLPEKVSDPMSQPELEARFARIVAASISSS